MKIDNFKLEYVKNCNFCGSEGSRHFIKKDGYNLVKCLNCGLIYVNPRPNKESLTMLYNSDYFSTSKGHEGYSDYINEKGELNENSMGFIKKRFGHLRKLKDRGGRILDVGCAYGFFLNEVMDYWEPYGVEMSHEAVTFAKKRFGIEVFEGDFIENLKNFPNGFFDVITMWEFLDHVPNPKENIERAYQLLKSGGILSFNISSVDSFRRIINGVNWRPIKPPEHLYNYSLAVVKKKLKEIGFKKFIIKGKNEVGIRDIISNPDINRTNMLEGKLTNYKFKYPIFIWIRLYTQALACYISEKTSIGDWTIGSALDIYAIK